MTEKEQQQAFAHDVDILVDRYREEFDLSYASLVGVLAIKLILMAAECGEESEGGEDNAGDIGSSGHA